VITPERWSRIEPILDRALDLPAAERAAFLEEACGEDVDLRRAVERLLRSSEAAEASLLEGSAADLAAPLLDAPAGVVLDRYELVRLLGSGGMGSVYLARDRTLGRMVALKFLPPHVAADPDAIRRFRNEARAASALDHPNIAVVHDTAETEDGRPFIVMGFYEGETLRDRIADEPLSIAEALALATDVAEGLAAAHAAGIVHRDIKPSNILVTPEGRARILDFGIAKIAGHTVTGPSATLGTVAYMSPEQTRPGDIDGRTDLWSLGVVLYEALAGSRPFAADDNAAVIHSIRNDQPQPLRDLRPDVPESLARIVERCLRKDPDRRFPDADALLRALRATIGEAEVGQAAAPAHAPRRARLRRSLALALVAAAVLSIAVLGYTALRDRFAEPGHRAIETRAGATGAVRIAVLPFAVLGEEQLAYLEEGMVELFSTQLDGAGPLRSVDPRALLAFLRMSGGDESDAAAPPDGQEVARRFDAALFVTGSVVEAGGRLRVRAALYDSEGSLQAEASSAAGDEGEIFELVDEVARELIGSRYAGERERLTRLAAATTSSLPALKAYLEGEQALRAGHFDEALASFRAAVAQDSAFALAWYRLAVAAEWTIRPAIAEEAAQMALELSTTLPEHDRLLVRGWHAYATGDAAEAERSYRRVLDGYPDDVEAWIQLGEVLFHYGPLGGRPLAEAKPAFQRVLSFEPTHEGALLHLARIAAREGEHAQLAELVERLVAAHPESEIAVEARALRAFAAGDEVASRQVLRELRSLDSDAVLTAVWTVGYTLDAAAVARLAQLLTDAGRPAEVRAVGHLLLATAELARGRPRAAKAELAAAHALNAAWALELGAGWAAAGIVPGDVWGLDSLRTALAEWDVTAVPSSPGPSAFLSAHDGAHGVLKTYLLASLDLSRGDADAVAAAVADLERAEGTAAVETLAAELARRLRAESLSQSGRHGDALAVLESADRHSPYTLAVASPFHAGSRARYLRAELLADLGRGEEALDFFTSMGTGSLFDLPYVAPAQLQAAALLEAAGQPERAVRHYRRVAELWRDAGPELRETVEEARRKAEVVR